MSDTTTTAPAGVPAKKARARSTAQLPAVAAAPPLPAVVTSETGQVLALIGQMAKDPTIDVDRLERVFALRREMQKEQAEREFTAAMQAVQASIPRIRRDASNTHTNSRYARLETISAAIDPIVNRNGLTLSFGTAECPVPGHFRVTCDVSHIGGHTKLYHLDLPADGLGAKGAQTKTGTHAAGSTLSYGRRYLKTLIFDVTITNSDDDGNRAAGVAAVEEVYITDEQVQALRDLMKEVGADEAAFVQWANVEALESIAARHFKDAVAALNRKRKAAK